MAQKPTSRALKLPALSSGELTVGHGETEAMEQVGWADPNLFSLLPLPTLAGELFRRVRASQCARAHAPYGAEVFLGAIFPSVKTLTINRQHAFEIVAVIEDLPATNAI